MKSLFLSKKASERLAGVLVSIIISIMAGMMFIYLGFFYNPSGEYLSQHYAHDIAGTVHAIQTVPGDISITYPLQEGMQISTNEHQIVARHIPTTAAAEAFFMEMKNTQIKDVTAEHKLFLTKNQGIISITNNPVDLTTTCPSALHLRGKEETIRIQVGESKNDFYTSNELYDLKKRFETEAKIEGFDTEELSPSFTVLLSSSEIKKDDLSKIILRVPDTVDKVADYEHILCQVFKKLETSLLIQVEKVSTTDENYLLSIDLSINEKDKEEFEKEEIDFTRQIMQALHEAIQ